MRTDPSISIKPCSTMLSPRKAISKEEYLFGHQIRENIQRWQKQIDYWRDELRAMSKIALGRQLKAEGTGNKPHDQFKPLEQAMTEGIQQLTNLIAEYEVELMLLPIMTEHSILDNMIKFQLLQDELKTSEAELQELKIAFLEGLYTSIPLVIF